MARPPDDPPAADATWSSCARTPTQAGRRRRTASGSAGGARRLAAGLELDVECSRGAPGSHRTVPTGSVCSGGCWRSWACRAVRLAGAAPGPRARRRPLTVRDRAAMGVGVAAGGRSGLVAGWVGRRDRRSGRGLRRWVSAGGAGRRSSRGCWPSRPRRRRDVRRPALGTGGWVGGSLAWTGYLMLVPLVGARSCSRPGRPAARPLEAQGRPLHQAVADLGGDQRSAPASAPDREAAAARTAPSRSPT